MKTHTKTPIVTAITLGLAFAALAGGDSKPKKHGKDILHIDIQKRMANEGIVANARGDVHVQLHTEGDKTHQDVHIHLHHLTAGDTYQLVAQVDDDTNLVQVTEVIAKDDGNAEIDLQDHGPKPHPGHVKPGNVKMQLPAELEPVTAIHELLVLDSTGATVLDADLTSPDKFEYLVKRDLSTDTVDAKLDIKANGHKGKVHLAARNLTAGADYSLALNGTVAGTDTADAKGHVDMRAELDSPADIFALNSVALLDATSTAVVSTTLP